MKAIRGLVSSLRLYSVLIVFLLTMQHAQRGGCESASTLTATLTGTTLSVTIPYHAARAGSGELLVEVLDPEDKVLGRAERNVKVNEGN